jgi:hypothetical protein
MGYIDVVVTDAGIAAILNWNWFLSHHSQNIDMKDESESTHEMKQKYQTEASI